MAGRCIADIFLNFQLHAEVVSYTGVSMGPMYEEGEEVNNGRWAFWDRNLMGFTASPYNSTKILALVTKEVRKGNICHHGTGANSKELNPFYWHSVCLNLHGVVGYNPMFTWVAKLLLDGRISCGLSTFVDSERLVDRPH